MNDDSRKRLIEFLGEEYIEFPYWWCDHCQAEKSPYQVTFYNKCTLCGKIVVWKENTRTFRTPDEKAMFNRLVKKHLWNKFAVWAKDNKFNWQCFDTLYDDWETGFYKWLLSLDENGDSRLCVLANKFLKGKE